MTQYNYDRRHRQDDQPALTLLVKIAILLVVVILLASTMAGCRRDTQGGYNATATYGAEMYAAQLTAIAGEQP